MEAGGQRPSPRTVSTETPTFMGLVERSGRQRGLRRGLRRSQGKKIGASEGRFSGEGGRLALHSPNCRKLVAFPREASVRVVR